MEPSEAKEAKLSIAKSEASASAQLVTEAKFDVGGSGASGKTVGGEQSRVMAAVNIVREKDNFSKEEYAFVFPSERQEGQVLILDICDSIMLSSKKLKGSM